LNAGEIRLQKMPEDTIRRLGSSKDKTQANKLTEVEDEGDVTKYKNNIAMLRRMRGFTQAYMAEKLGVARQTYINIEKGLKELTVSQVRILEDELQVTFEDLLGVGSDGGHLDYKKYFK
jgi:DNA-binding XRE family transcriptional regulator